MGCWDILFFLLGAGVGGGGNGGGRKHSENWIASRHKLKTKSNNEILK